SGGLPQNFQFDATLAGLFEAAVTNKGSTLAGTAFFGLDTKGRFTAPKFSGEAKVDLGLSLGFHGDAIFNPKFSADLVFEWDFGTGSAAPAVGSAVDFSFNANSAIEGTFRNFGFRNVSFDVGASLPSFLGPVIADLQKVTKPMQPILDFLTAEVPILGEFGVHEKVIDLIAGTLPSGFDSALDVLDKIAGMVNSFGDLQPGSFTVPLGD